MIPLEKISKEEMLSTMPKRINVKLKSAQKVKNSALLTKTEGNKTLMSTPKIMAKMPNEHKVPPNNETIVPEVLKPLKDLKCVFNGLASMVRIQF